MYFGFLCLVLGCSLIGLAGKWYYFADLFTHFRPQAVIAALVILPLVVWHKDWPSVGLVAVIVSLNLAVMIPAYRAMAPLVSEKTQQASKLRVLSVNVLVRNTNMAALQEMIAAHDPDIVLVIEANEDRMASLQGLSAIYPYSALYPQNANSTGMAVYAKAPFTASQIIPDPFIAAPLLELVFADYRFYGVHPIPPVSHATNRHQKIYMQKLAELVSQSDRPVIAAGDYNATLWAENMRLIHKTGLKTSNSRILAWTWPHFLPLAIQIDHVLIKDMAVSAFKTLPNAGSDHRAVLADITY